ncbi:hypothetical protein PCYB_006220, partial [Plasmodium cynomolgi strain B]
SYKEHKIDIDRHSIYYDIYVDTCNKINSKYKIYNFDNADRTCTNVMAYLNFITPDRKSIYDDSRCRYLYYWIYDSLLENNKNYDVAFNWYSIILTEYFNVSDDFHICRNYKEKSEKIILENSAKIIELYEPFNNDWKTFDCAHAQKCSKIYTKYVNECHNDYDFCLKLQNFKEEYEKMLKSIGTPCDTEKILPSALKHDHSVIIIIPIIILTTLPFLLFVLYKFTPIGSRITYRNRRRNVFFENQFDNSNTLFPTTGRSMSTEENIAYNIAYNSATHS